MESLLNQLCIDSHAALDAFKAKDREAIGHMIDFLQYTIDAVNLELDQEDGDGYDDSPIARVLGLT